MNNSMAVLKKSLEQFTHAFLGKSQKESLGEFP